jgi:predicted type IV restriction endonuclease
MPIDISKQLRKYIPILKKAREQGVNEAETSLRISKLFEDVLGYDLFEEISKEHVIKDRCVDYAIKLNGEVEFLVEVKRAGLNLRGKHIEQASHYASQAGIPWVVLTSGGYWQLYHLTFDEGIQCDLIWSIDILEDNIKETAPKLALLHRKSVIKGELDDHYLKFETLSAKSILQAIFQENVIRMISSHLKKMSGIRIGPEDLAKSIKDMISKETWEEIGDIKIKKKRKTPKPRKKVETSPLKVVSAGGLEEDVKPSPSSPSDEKENVEES